MIRYFAIAAAIVFACILAMLSLGHRVAPESTPAPYSSTVAQAGSPRPESTSAATSRPLGGDAPWALSALPECFHQTLEIRGSPAYVREHERAFAPAAWHRVRDARLVASDCLLEIAEHSGVVTRGADTRLGIPPDTTFYVVGKTLVVDRVARGTENLRLYTLRNGSAPVFISRVNAPG